jgi:hypothetical protein
MLWSLPTAALAQLQAKAAQARKSGPEMSSLEALAGVVLHLPARSGRDQAGRRTSEGVVVEQATLPEMPQVKRADSTVVVVQVRG